MLEILVLSDIHGRRTVLERIMGKASTEHAVSLVIVAGDITYFESMDKALNTLLLINKILNTEVLFVPGNCDPPHLLEIEQFDSIVNIHNRVYEAGNYYFVGVGGSNPTPFNTWIEWREEELEAFIKQAYHYPRDKLIVVTHAPIYGVMDEINGEHVGSKSFRKFLEEHGALAWITGHLHEYSGYVFVKDTLVVNPGPAMHGYYALLKIVNGKPVVTLNSIY